MELVGHIPLPDMYNTRVSDITGFYQDGREFAVVGLKDTISAVFIDITDPFSNPFEVGHINGIPNHLYLKVKNGIVEVITVRFYILLQLPVPFLIPNLCNFNSLKKGPDII